MLSAALVWSDTVDDAIDRPGRLPQDLVRDERSRPAAVIALLNIAAGDRVVDVFAGGGYYSELLASVVGDSGEVLLHNNQGFRAWGVNILNDRFTDRTIDNITQHDREIADLELGTHSLDAALLVMAYHDMYVVPKRYNGEKYVPVGHPADVEHFLQQIYRSLKPGARFVVVDHAAGDTTSADDAFELHRMHECFARTEIESRGFRFVESSDALRNPADDRSMIVFDSDVQGRTDRFVLAFEKPSQ
jgi:predicted methyltransferase